MKEIKIGDVFEFGGKKLTVRADKGVCFRCVFNNDEHCQLEREGKEPKCFGPDREDETNVVYVPAKR